MMAIMGATNYRNLVIMSRHTTISQGRMDHIELKKLHWNRCQRKSSKIKMRSKNHNNLHVIICNTSVTIKATNCMLLDKN